MKLTDFKLLTFDVIGTLIDFETGLLRAFRSLGGPKAAAASDDEIFAPYKRGRDQFYGRSSVAMKDVYLHVAGEMGFRNDEATGCFSVGRAALAGVPRFRTGPQPSQAAFPPGRDDQRRPDGILGLRGDAGQSVPR